MFSVFQEEILSRVRRERDLMKHELSYYKSQFHALSRERENHAKQAKISQQRAQQSNLAGMSQGSSSPPLMKGGTTSRAASFDLSPRDGSVGGSDKLTATSSATSVPHGSVDGAGAVAPPLYTVATTTALPATATTVAGITRQASVDSGPATPSTVSSSARTTPGT